MIDIMLQAARTELLEASADLADIRACKKPMVAREFLEGLAIMRLYRSLDRVWELQCMDKMVGSVTAAKAARIIPHCSSHSLDLPNPFAEVSR